MPCSWYPYSTYLEEENYSGDIPDYNLILSGTSFLTESNNHLPDHHRQSI
jgi:hypothetical protein